MATLKTFLRGDLSALGQWETQIFCQFSFLNFSIGSVFPVTHPRFHFNMDAWICLKHFCVVTFLHLENGRHKFSVNSVFRTFLLVQFSPSPILGLFHHLCVAMHKTFMHGDLSAPVKSDCTFNVVKFIEMNAISWPEMLKRMLFHGPVKKLGVQSNASTVGHVWRGRSRYSEVQ